MSEPQFNAAVFLIVFGTLAVCIAALLYLAARGLYRWYRDHRPMATYLGDPWKDPRDKLREWKEGMKP